MGCKKGLKKLTYEPASVGDMMITVYSHAPVLQCAILEALETPD